MTNTVTNRTTARLTFAMLAVFGGLLSTTWATTSHAQGKGGPGGIINFDTRPVLDHLSSLGNTYCIGPPRTVEAAGAICILNDWQGRDSRAAAAGMFDHRFSTNCAFGAHWYCYFERR
jgi:hypothetical protein